MVSRMRSFIDHYRNYGARALLDRAREAAAQLLVPPPPKERALPVRPRPAEAGEAGSTSSTPEKVTNGVAPGGVAHEEVADSQEVLVGICSSIALRDLNLIDALLAQLEQMEEQEEDPEALERLYQLDHLATRLRRNAENLRVLAGGDAGRASDETSSLLDVIRGAMSSIEQYTRIEIGRVAPLAVVGFAADDVSRILAELLDNATTQSPPTSPVSVSAHLTETGSVLVRIEDTGIGLPREQLDKLNQRLEAAPVLDSDAVQHMGLAVVRRLASRHEVRVWLSRRAPHGTIASVLLPAALIRDLPQTPLKKKDTAKKNNNRSASHRRTPAEAPTRPLRSGTAAKGSASTTASGMPRRTPGSEVAASVAAGPEGSRNERPAAKGATPADKGTNNGTVATTGSVGEEAGAATTTPSGLPRRVPRSIKNSTAPADHVVWSEKSEAEARAGRQQLLADLGAFAEGEQAALEERRRESGEERRQESRDGERQHEHGRDKESEGQ